MNTDFGKYTCDHTAAGGSRAGGCVAVHRFRHHFAEIEASRVVEDANAPAAREALERNVRHRTAPAFVGEAGVVDHVSIADLDAVMGVAGTLGDQLRAERRFMTRLLYWFDLGAEVSPALRPRPLHEGSVYTNIQFHGAARTVAMAA